MAAVDGTGAGDGDRGEPFRPWSGNPLRTRADVERALRALVEPLRPSFSPGRARLRLGHTGVVFPDAAEELEGFARPLWGLVPLALGGGRFADWGLWREGLAAGTDPGHPEFWGFAERDQRMVEMAAIGFGLAFLPGELWEPLPEPVRGRLVAWLERIDVHLPVPNNWQFFRVLVNLGLRRVGRFRHPEAEAESLAILERCHLERGWYRDGEAGHVDWYLPWAFHTYGLLYAASGLGDPDVAARFRERARAFAGDFQHWFDPVGRGVPFGRSLTYRFAQVAFLGALVLADEEALPWGRVKGLLLRHLRWWATRPFATRDGLLTLGYGYPNGAIVEPYSSSGSPYWGLKAFLALAAPGDHAFWRAEEEPLPPLQEPVAQPHARHLLSRDATQTVALSAGQAEVLWPGGPAKYAKLAYSSLFAFGVPVPETRPHQNVHDSMLALREEDGPWRVRETVEEWSVEEGRVRSRWRPWPDVVVETVLAGRCPWHWRLHRIETARPLHACEAGFALGWEGLEPGLRSVAVETSEDGRAVLLRTRWGTSGIRCHAGGRTARMQPALPNTNLVEPRTVVPALFGPLAPGVHRLACAVLATDRPDATWSAVPPPDPTLTP